MRQGSAEGWVSLRPAEFALRADWHPLYPAWLLIRKAVGGVRGEGNESCFELEWGLKEGEKEGAEKENPEK
jgi:hypothetical protein